MKRFLPALILVVSLVLLLPSAARADTTINPSDDAWVDLNVPDTPIGDAFLLADYTNQGSWEITRRAFLRFSLSALTYAVDDTVKVRVYVYLPPLFTVGTLALWSTGDDWNGGADGNGDETTLMWSTAPAGIDSLNAQSVNTSSGGTWVEFTGADLRDFINAQRAGDGVASFYIEWSGCSTCSQGDSIIFEDRENSGETGNRPQLFAPTPTSVKLTSFTGRPVPRGNLLTWETADERDCAGFSLYRSAPPQQAGVRLNDTVIPARGLGQGAVYEFLDDTALPGTPYYYTLLDVDMDGSETPHGPVMLTAWWAHLPLIERRH